MNKMILFTNHNKYGFKKFKFDFVKAVNPLYMHVFRPFRRGWNWRSTLLHTIYCI